ncbi:MAG TPA: HNH endonuclease signature motif containing protein, partial [Chthonomonadaceae bacterium]|nr:HNH endonuclease signature motif containing protein [Chthonomonadaceae bacterium]
TETYFQGRCAYCQSPQALMNVTFEVDHIIPEKEGGLTLQDNLAFSCPLCNGSKRAQTRGHDPVTGKEVPLYHPRRQNWSRHFCWAEDLYTIGGRTQSGRATVEALQLNNPNLLRLRIIWLVIGSTPPHWPAPSLLGF